MMGEFLFVKMVLGRRKIIIKILDLDEIMDFWFVIFFFVVIIFIFNILVEEFILLGILIFFKVRNY